MDNRHFLTIEEIHKVYRQGVLGQSLVPMEWALSLAMPTLRFTRPAYCWFVNPAIRRPGMPLKLATPESYFALDAMTGELLIYNAWELPIISTQELWLSIELPSRNETKEKIQDSFTQLLRCLNQASLAFFSGMPFDQSISNVIIEYLDPQMIPWYRFIAPDFWQSLQTSMIEH